jgi:hypothetical protein
LEVWGADHPLLYRLINVSTWDEKIIRIMFFTRPTAFERQTARLAHLPVEAGPDPLGVGSKIAAIRLVKPFVRMSFHTGKH